MSYMESKMQDQIEGGIALQNAICDDACNIYKQTGIMPLDMKMQRDELLECLRLLTEKGSKQETGLGWNERLRMARALIAKVSGEQQ